MFGSSFDVSVRPTRRGSTDSKVVGYAWVAALGEVLGVVFPDVLHRDMAVRELYRLNNDTDWSADGFSKREIGSIRSRIKGNTQKLPSNYAAMVAYWKGFVDEIRTAPDAAARRDIVREVFGKKYRVYCYNEIDETAVAMPPKLITSPSGRTVTNNPEKGTETVEFLEFIGDAPDAELDAVIELVVNPLATARRYNWKVQ